MSELVRLIIKWPLMGLAAVMLAVWCDLYVGKKLIDHAATKIQIIRVA